ncbi:DMT family transporter [Alphaproteobacteria bacterium LSUCC0684]
MTTRFPSLHGNMLGIAYMIMAVLAGVVTSLIIKELSPLGTVLVLLSLRFVFSIPPLALAAFVARGRSMLSVSRWDRLLMRIVTGQIGIIFWFLAITHISLGQATALFQSSAIFVTILSPLILKEKVGIYRGSAVFIGLIGIFMLTNPFAESLNIGALFGLGSAISGAFLVVLLRMLGRTDEPVTVSLWHNITGALLYPVLVLITGETGYINGIVPEHLLLLVILGIGASFVQIGFTSAYRHGEAAVLVPIRYLSVPIAGLLGWWIWAEKLDLIEITGMVIVVASCLFISIREYRLSRKAATPRISVTEKDQSQPV